MVTSYPVNDYRSYLAHKAPSFSNASEWKEADQHKYYKREWTGNSWKYYYTKEQWDSAHSRQHELNEFRESRAEKREGGKSGSESVNKNRAKEMIGDYRVSSQVKSAVRPIAGNNVANTAAKAVVGAQNTAEAAGSAVAGVASDAYHAVAGAIGDKVDWAGRFVEEQAQVYELDTTNTDDTPTIKKDENGKPIYANTIAGNTVRIANSIADWAKQAFSDVKSWIKTASTNVGTWMTERKNELIAKYQEVRSFVGTIAQNLKNSAQVQAVIGTFRSGFNAVKSGITSVITSVGSFISSIPEIASGVLEGIGDLLGLTNKIDAAMDEAVDNALNEQVKA